MDIKLLMYNNLQIKTEYYLGWPNNILPSLATLQALEFNILETYKLQLRKIS